MPDDAKPIGGELIGIAEMVGDIKLNAGGIEGKHGGEGWGDGLADGLGEVRHTLEHKLNVVRKTELEVGKERGISDLGKAAEIPELPADA